MLCCGLIHGDLSPYNVLVDAEGPVLIDFPQVVSATGTNAARQMLLRDVHNLTAYLARWAPESLDTWYGEEMWALFASGALQADMPLTGALEHEEHLAYLGTVRQPVDEAPHQATPPHPGHQRPGPAPPP